MNEIKTFKEDDYIRKEYNPAYHINNLKKSMEHELNEARKHGLRVYIDENSNITVENTTSKDFCKLDYKELFDADNDERE